MLLTCFCLFPVCQSIKTNRNFVIHSSFSQRQCLPGLTFSHVDHDYKLEFSQHFCSCITLGKDIFVPTEVSCMSHLCPVEGDIIQELNLNCLGAISAVWNVSFCMLSLLNRGRKIDLKRNAQMKLVYQRVHWSRPARSLYNNLEAVARTTAVKLKVMDLLSMRLYLQSCTVDRS